LIFFIHYYDVCPFIYIPKVGKSNEIDKETALSIHYFVCDKTGYD